MNEKKQQQIFDEWLARHRGLFFKVVRAYAFTPPDQEDLFQEVATQVWLSIQSFDTNPRRPHGSIDSPFMPHWVG